jgi:phospholipase/carboxylesterase
VSAGLLDHRIRPAAGAATGALVLLHGRGADEHDLFGLLDALDPERRLLGITPGAPLRLDGEGRHWYRFAGIPTPEPESFLAATESLARFLSTLPVPVDRIVLGGFSQGCVMTWAYSLAADLPQPAGVVALSGFLPRVPSWPLDPSRLAGVPVAIAHGTLDDVIPVTYGRQAHAFLADAGVEADLITSPYPHGVDPGWLESLRLLVTRALPD